MDLDRIVQEIFADNADVIVIQVRKLDDGLDIKTSTLETMPSDSVMHKAQVFIRSIHYRGEAFSDKRC